MLFELIIDVPRYFSLISQLCFADACDALRLLYKYGANQLHVDKDSLTGMNYSTQFPSC